MTLVRTRFAPSPTGKLHLGGAHTALYCWLYARRLGGQFVLRVEDTDRERSTPENVNVILDGLKWLELDWDEGPFFQSERTELYTKAVTTCLEKGTAYRCVCTPEQIQAKREKALAEKRKVLYDGTCRDKNLDPDCGPHVVRFKMPRTGTTPIDDMIKGQVAYPNEELDDWIIARTDGSPTYNFCVVVDDADMKITHVIRGDDHFNNTPKQLHVYAALGYTVPQFAHMPLMHGQDGSKLSKRHGATSVTEYRKLGFLPSAVRNYLARLGWAHGDQELFTDEELIQWFDVADLSKSASIFDSEKFLWVNAQHMRQTPLDKLASLLLPFLTERGFEATEGEWLNKLVAAYLERSRTLVEMADNSAIFFQKEIHYDEKAAKKNLRPVVLEPLVALAQGLAKADPFDVQTITPVFERICKQFELKFGKIAQPVRVAVTGGPISPGIYETLELIGQAQSLQRLEKAIEYIRQRAEQNG